MKPVSNLLTIALLVTPLLGLASPMVFQQASCPITGDPRVARESAAALGVILGKALIPLAVDWAAKAVVAQGQEKTTEWDLDGSGYLYSISRDGKVLRHVDRACLVIVIPKAGVATPSEGDAFGKRYALARKSFLQLPPTPLIYIEAAMDTSEDNRFIRIRPRTVYFREPTTSGWGAKTRELAVTLSFRKPGEADPFGSAKIALTGLAEGRWMNYIEQPEEGTPTSAWLPLAGLDDEEKALVADIKKVAKEVERQAKVLQLAELRRAQLQSQAGSKYLGNLKPEQQTLLAESVADYCKQVGKLQREKDKKAEEENEDCPPERYFAKQRALHATAQINAIADISNFAVEELVPPVPVLTSTRSAGPYNIHAHVTETRSASKFFAFLGQGLSDSKADLSTALTNRLVSSSREAVIQQAASAAIVAAGKRDDAMVLALEARTAVNTAQETLDSLSVSATTAEKKNAMDQLLIAKIKANKAFRAAEFPVPYPEAGGL